MPQPRSELGQHLNRRDYIGGSDARIIMGDDEVALLQLWREKRGEVQAEDLSDVLMVQLGTVTEDLNRRWYERHTGNAVTHVQRRMQHPVHKWMAATLDGLVDPGGAVFEAKFMLPWTFSEEAAAEKQTADRAFATHILCCSWAMLSIITGGGKWVNIGVNTDPLYQHLLLTAEKKFWRCVMSGEEPRLFGVEPPRPRLEAVRIVDMSASNAWAELAATFLPDTTGLSGARGRQGRPEKAGSGRRQGGRRSRAARQAIQIRSRQFRAPGCGGRPCTALKRDGISFDSLSF